MDIDTRDRIIVCYADGQTKLHNIELSYIPMLFQMGVIREYNTYRYYSIAANLFYPIEAIESLLMSDLAARTRGRYQTLSLN